MEKDSYYHITKDETHLKIVFGSSYDNINKACEETKHFLETRDLRTASFSVGLIVREALTNAVKHGNRLDLQKQVSYLLVLEKSHALIEIQDQGQGFDWSEAMQQHPQSLSDHGRGIYIMQQYSTDCQYNEKGNRLTLTKELNI